MQEVVGHVIACVAKDATTISGQRGIPIPEYDGMCKLPEWRCKDDEKRRRHDKSVFIHWQVVVDAVEEEMQRDAHTVIWQVAVDGQTGHLNWEGTYSSK
jgi:hypothetical protein